jgi:hypothetical protein
MIKETPMRTKDILMLGSGYAGVMAVHGLWGKVRSLEPGTTLLRPDPPSE